MLLINRSSVILFVLTALCLIDNVRATDENSLELLHIIFRHGNRSNDFRTMYPGGGNTSSQYHPHGYGQLTNDGTMSMYKLGQYLRKKYGYFLGDYYFPDEIKSRCSSYARTKVSLMLVMAGLFPPKDEQLWSSDLIWQPIAFDYKLKLHDLEYFGIVCPNYIKHYDRLYRNKEYGDYLQKYEFLFDYLSNITGSSVRSLLKVHYLNVGLQIDDDWGFRLPNWTRPVWPKMIREATHDYYYEATYNTDLKKYAIGFLLKKIINDTQTKIDGTMPNRKLYIYSAHDYNLVFLLRILNLLSLPLEPTYASFMAIEMHKINGSHYLKFFYENYSNDVKYVVVPNCGSPCPFDTFKTLMEDYLPNGNDTCGNEHLLGDLNEKL